MRLKANLPGGGFFFVLSGLFQVIVNHTIKVIGISALQALFVPAVIVCAKIDVATTLRALFLG